MNERVGWMADPLLGGGSTIAVINAVIKRCISERLSRLISISI